MYIKDDEINKYFNEPNWKSAHALFQQDTIHNMSVVKEGQIYQIVGTVVNNKPHTATIQIDSSGNILEFNCDCQYATHNELACGHIGALLLKFYGLETSEIPFSFNQKGNYLEKIQEIQIKNEEQHLKNQAAKTISLIEYYKDFHKQQSLILDKNVRLIPEVRNSFDRLYLTYKIAGQKSYSIKNIHTLIENIKTKQTIIYGIGLTTDHDEEAFDHSSLKQIHFIEENIFQNMDDEHTLKINQNNIDDFFLSHFDNLDININFTTIDLKNLLLEIKKDDDYTAIKFKEPEGIIFIGKQYLYYFDYATLNRYSKQCSDALRPLLLHLENNTLTIPNDRMHLFSKYIIDSILPYVEFTGDDIDEYLPMDISLLIYVDLNSNNELSITLDYRDDQGNSILEDPQDLVLPLKLDRVLEILDTYLEYDDITRMYYLHNEEDVYDFITRILPDINKDCEVYISEEIKMMNKPKNMNLNIGVRLKNDLLEIDLNSINVDKNEIQDILYAYQNKKNYHRLKSGEFINLGDPAIKDLDLLFNDLNLDYKDVHDGKVAVDKYRSLYLNNFINSSSLQFNRNNHFKELISRIQKINIQDIHVPKNYQPILRDYQVFGFKWLKIMSEYGFGGILADDMGLGKTLQVMTLLEDSINDNNVNLVVAPATLIYNWQDEIHKFSKKLKVLCITGNLIQRKKAIASVKDYDVIITSYDYIRRDFDLYKDITFNYFILDEAQYIKNQSTKNAQAVKAIHGKHRFALTGTPIENSLAELWSIFDFLMPQYLHNYSYFKENFEIPIIRNDDNEKQHKLKQMVEPFILRRTKKEVLNELPDKIERNIMISFTPDEEKVYLANLSTINQELQSAIQVNHVDKIQILAMMTRLRQLCCDQRILYKNIKEVSSKLKACIDIIENAKENEQKVLLFSSFTTSLELIEAELRKRDISYYVLTGATNKIKRHQLVNAFQNDKTTVFLISLKAGGTGLNLTSASTVIHYDPWWNMSAQNQATDRAYRIGQTNNVQVYKLIMKNSIEEKIQKLQEQKQDLSNMFVENNSGTISQMSTTDIMNLFQ